MRAGVVVALLALATSAPAAAGTVVKAAHNEALGATILVDARGLTLYLFTEDTSAQSYCVNDATFHCSKAWPPLLTTGKPKAGAGVKQSLLGTIKRPDGHLQVTYRHHPLYTFHGGYGLPGDKPGDVNGQDYVQIWFVVSPSGKPIEKPKP